MQKDGCVILVLSSQPLEEYAVPDLQYNLWCLHTGGQIKCFIVDSLMGE